MTKRDESFASQNSPLDGVAEAGPEQLEADDALLQLFSTEPVERDSGRPIDVSVGRNRSQGRSLSVLACVLAALLCIFLALRVQWSPRAVATCAVCLLMALGCAMALVGD